jgi:hypothetical protein
LRLGRLGVESDREGRGGGVWCSTPYFALGVTERSKKCPAKGVFGSPDELRYSHLNRARVSISCLLDWVGPSQHCRTHTENASQPGRVEKLKSSFTTQPSWTQPADHCSRPRARPPDLHPHLNFSSFPPPSSSRSNQPPPMRSSRSGPPPALLLSRRPSSSMGRRAEAGARARTLWSATDDSSLRRSNRAGDAARPRRAWSRRDSGFWQRFLSSVEAPIATMAGSHDAPSHRDGREPQRLDAVVDHAEPP